MKIKILNLEVNALTKVELKDALERTLQGGKLVKVGKVNTEFLLRSKESPEFAETLANFEYKIADGSGVLWAAKYLSLPVTKVPILRQAQAIWQMVYTGASLIFVPKYCTDPIPERFPGVEALYLMLDVAEKEKAPVYFFGAEKEVLSQAVEAIKSKFLTLVIAGYHEGYNYKDEEIIDDINKSRAKLLIVAHGSPKQEYWIQDHANKLKPVRVAVGEGGSFDFVAGVHKRAPKWMRKIGIEWLYRMFMNKNKTTGGGSRAKRIWRAVPVFVWTVVSDKIRNN